MRYKLFGKSGLRVSEMSLGTMTFGEEWGWGADKNESKKVFDAFLDAGGNFIDTANKYTEGKSEELVGEFISGMRDEIVLATKYTASMDFSKVAAAGNSRKNMVQSVEDSLRRLKTDYIDLYWLHAWDYKTPIEEIMRGLDDLVSAGKILYIGVSDTPAWIVSRMNMLAELRGWTEFTGLQIQYSLAERTSERELLPMAKELDMAVTPWGILHSGVLTGKYSGKDAKKEHSRGDDGRFLNETALEIADAVIEVADNLGKTPSQVATRWVMQQPYGVMIPIIGARKLSQLEDNLGAIEFSLDNEQLNKLNDASNIELGFPHEFLHRDSILTVVNSEKWPLIDNHRL